jgi:hypothetical protein
MTPKKGLKHVALTPTANKTNVDAVVPSPSPPELLSWKMAVTILIKGQ